MRIFSVYILRCSDQTLYTGVTNNLVRRMKEHESGFNQGSYTSSRLPVKLVYAKHFYYILDAIAMEKRLKKWSVAKKEALINGRLDLLPDLSKKRFNK